ncbi:hypothetical protein BB558_006200 [Smittium angustum]|uniref:TLC domain-containing protein n=1 Tax=Smittium angustum TaxID=133377 RepID=A0A2U1IYD4_SMIAN|nr:hypothetical protein BB558_006200 [Smittium angustum]
MTSVSLAPFIAGFGIGSLVLNLIFFVIQKNQIFTTKKQLAWILTFTTTVTVTVASLPYMYQLFRHNLDITKLVYSDTFSIMICGFFESYLFWDLAIGLRYYKSTFDPFTGYFHHSFYLLLVFFCASKGLSAIFVLFCIMELPTIVLAIGSIRKDLRKDWLFASCFFSTRLLLHVILIYRFYKYSPDRLVWKLIVSSFPLHIYWFSSFIKQQKRLRKQRKQQKLVELE